MSTFDSKFNVIYGYHGPEADYCTISETFEPDGSISTALVEGEVVSVGSNKTVDRAVGVALGGGSVSDMAELLATQPQYWTIVTGMDSVNYDALAQTGGVAANGSMKWVGAQVVAIRGTYVFQTDQFVTQTYVAGSRVTIGTSGNAGKVDLTDGSTNIGYTPFGEVHEYDSTEGILTVSVD